MSLTLLATRPLTPWLRASTAITYLVLGTPGKDEER